MGASQEQLLVPYENEGPKKRSSIKHRQSESRRAFNGADPILLKAMTKEFGEFRAVDQMTISIK